MHGNTKIKLAARVLENFCTPVFDLYFIHACQATDPLGPLGHQPLVYGIQNTA